MPKAELSRDGTTVAYMCPGCKHKHVVEAARWNWNGSLDKPTLSPSVRHFYVHPKRKEEVTTCHYYVRDGWIEFCSDCQHNLASQRVELAELQPQAPYIAENI